MSAPITLPMPETSAITFQRIKVESDESLPNKVSVNPAKPNAKPQVFKLPTLSTAPTSTTTTTGGMHAFFISYLICRG